METNEASQKAEKRIEEVRNSGATELGLWELGLSKLPDSLFTLTALQSLNLNHNNLKEIPESLGKLQQLHSLRLGYNQLRTLPHSIRQLSQLQFLHLRHNYMVELPDELRQLKQLQSLDLSENRLHVLPDWISTLSNLDSLILADNMMTSLPDSLGYLLRLKFLNISNNHLRLLPETIGQLQALNALVMHANALIDLPSSFVDLLCFETIPLDGNGFNQELYAAVKDSHNAVRSYLRAKAQSQIKLYEAKLILVGEGEVGKSCLLAALRGDPWEEGRSTTHGIEIRAVKVINPDSKKEITLNGWDFGGQRVYRPTHQLFFSAPAVYLVVWKPREGPQQGFVTEWIKLIKHREPDAKILVVATHGGPQQRQPDIDCQELWDLFGKETVVGFLHVESKPDANGCRRGIEELRDAIARVASALPEMGRAVPKHWQEVREELAEMRTAYLSTEQVLDICHRHQMDADEANLFVAISHRLGHLIHYKHDPLLRDIVVLKPDWLATAISFVLDDEETRSNHGLVRFSHLGQLWDDPERAAEYQYPSTLHPIFLRLMERFDLSYRVAGISSKDDSDPISLVAQLVPDVRPELDIAREWHNSPIVGDIRQVQICQIVDEKGQSAAGEGLFYQLIVRLQRYSLGRNHYNDSIHWKRGLILDDGYNGRAMLEHIGNDVRITVSAAYPERFLAMLTSEVKYLVESFWEGLQCNIMVPCTYPCGKDSPGLGLFDVQKLIESRRDKRLEYPCPVCTKWQNIDSLLRNVPAARQFQIESLFTEFSDVKSELSRIRPLLMSQQNEVIGRFDRVDLGTQRILSRIDDAFTNLIHVLTDEAREGPRLFSLVPVDRSDFDPRNWVSSKFLLTLWCEHSRLPLPNLYGKGSQKGVYEIDLSREWFKKAAPFLRVLTGTLSLVLPVASSAVKLALDDTAYKAIEEQLDFSKSVIDSAISEATKIREWMGPSDKTTLEHGEIIEAQGATLRELHALLKTKDPSFGGLVRVMNKRQEFLWVHPRFEKEY